MIALTLGPTSNSASDLSTVSVTLNGTTAGRHIVVGIVFNHASATISSVTCTSESDLTPIGSILRSTMGAVNYGLQWFYLSNITTGGNKTITCTFSTTVSSTATALEFSGGETSDFYDGAEGEATGSSTSPSAVVTSQTANALFIGMCATKGGGEPTTGGGYTTIAMPNIGWWEAGEYYLDASSAGANAVDWTAGNDQWAVKAAAFRVLGEEPPTGGDMTITRSIFVLP